ncbi:Extracellular metalloprotease [Metarhizium anisopliae]|nr:Extracellular metalloprotease [Metarhizium anisopliae]
MPSLSYLAAALLALGSIASATLLTRQQGEFCDSQPDADILALHEQLSKDESRLTRRDTGERISLETWVHVIATNQTKQGGWLTKAEIDSQMKVLNNAFAPSNLTFNLNGTTWNQNASWAMHPKHFEMDYKTKLHKGTSRTLNLYYLPGIYDGLGGFCRFPGIYTNRGEELDRDGCVIGSFTLPGNPGVLGMVTIHEVGHWCGLLHTFHGGCSEEGGDFIADTAAEASANNLDECPVGRDTCPDLPGLDPVDNYMDYSGDSCLERFTPGQTVRMRGILSLVRLGGWKK